MPIYVSDENGNIYEADVDYSCEGVTDVTVGETHSKDLAVQQNRIAMENSAIEAIDEQNKSDALGARIEARKQKAFEMSKKSLLANPEYQAHLTRKAYLSGCKCGGDMSGTPRDRWIQMDHTQKVINHHLSGNRQTVAYRPDQGEIMQMQGQKLLQKHLENQYYKEQESMRETRSMEGQKTRFIRRG